MGHFAESEMGAPTGDPERTEYRYLIPRSGATEGIPKHALGQGLPLASVFGNL